MQAAHQEVQADLGVEDVEAELLVHAVQQLPHRRKYRLRGPSAGPCTIPTCCTTARTKCKQSAEIGALTGSVLSTPQQPLYTAAGWTITRSNAGSLCAAQRRTGEAVATFGSAAVYALANAVRKWLSCAMYA